MGDISVFLKEAIPIFVALVAMTSVSILNPGNLQKKHVYGLMAIWVIVWTLPYWILGPYSYARIYDEADISTSRYLHDVANHIGGSFLHGIQGGTDYYAVTGFGGQAVSLERFLFSIFPLSIALLLHKLSIVCISLFGSYLLIRKMVSVSRFNAFCFSAYFSVFNPYALFSTVQHGIGYAFIPLAIYIFVCNLDNRHYWVYTSLLSGLISVSVSPAHSFIVIICGIGLFTLCLPVYHYRKLLLASVVLVGLVVLNWGEALYGMSQFGFLSARVVNGSTGKSAGELLWGAITYLNGKTDYYVAGFGFSHAFVLSILTLLLGFYYRLAVRWKIVLSVALAIYTSSIVYIFAKWPAFSFLSSVNFDRIGYYIIVPICVLAAHIAKEKQLYWARFLPVLFLGFAVLILTQNHVRASTEIYIGNQKRLTSISNLNERLWEPDTLYRVVSAGPYTGFHPNYCWVYGIETFDGYTSLIPKRFVEFWHYGVHQNKYVEPEPTFGGGNIYITYVDSSPLAGRTEFFGRRDSIDIDQKIDVNLLKLANVGFVLSYFPLKGEHLTKVSGPDARYHYPTDGKKGFAYYSSKFRSYIFNTPDISVYGFDNYSDRAYFPHKVLYTDLGLDLYERYRLMSEHYEPNIAFTDDRSVNTGLGEVGDVRKVVGGYEVDVTVSEPGLLVLNVYPYPYWEVSIHGESIPFFPVNAIQMGVNVGIGEHTILYKYKRPLLREKIMTFLGFTPE